MTRAKRLMIIGAGDLGTKIVQLLANSSLDSELRLVGRSEESLARITNLARFSAIQQGRLPSLSYAVTDLDDVDRSAAVISDFQPDVILLTASLQSWWVISTLPPAAYQTLYEANFGPWLPMHLVPVLKAMQAVRAAASPAIVVNAAFPDAVHPVLAAAGLAPDVGIGNVANNIPAIRVAAAEAFDASVDRVDVQLIAHHYVSHRLSRHGDAGSAELHLTVTLDGHDVSSEIDRAELLRQLPARHRRTGGLAGQLMTAASAVSVLVPLLTGATSSVHAPGPLGLPGGYPVRIEAGALRLNLPEGVSEAEAVRINKSGQLSDGILDIDDGGTVTFSEPSLDVMRTALGYDAAKMHWSEAELRATELAQRLALYRARVG